MIIRTEYIDWLHRFRDKRVIKIITGIRRCGKSTLIEQYQADLLERGVSIDRILAINLEDFSMSHLFDPEKLYRYVIERLSPDGVTYVFLDEIQNVADFPRVIDGLFIQKNIDLYVTGSNAFLLSSEIATLLSGRYVEIRMLPLSFREFATFHHMLANPDLAYQWYLTEGAFPYVTAFDHDMKAVREYLRGIYSTVLLKDVMTRTRISDGLTLESVVRFLFDNIGNITSARRIGDLLSESGRKTDAKTVDKYLTALTESFVVHRAMRYDIKGKQHLKSLEKYYVADLGLRSTMLGRSGADVGRSLENVVYLELLRRGFEVFVGKLGDAEVDFVARDGDRLTYFQVAATVRDAETLARELRPLQTTGDAYPKYLLTLDRDPAANINGIIVENAVDWLLG